MAKKFSIIELKTIAKEINNQLEIKLKEKRQKIFTEQQEKFKESEEFQKYVQCLRICDLPLDSKEYVKEKLYLHFVRMFEIAEPLEHVPYKSISSEEILHELSLEQIKKGEDFNLDELINKYIEKYA